MRKNRKHNPAFKLNVVEEYHAGESITALAKKWGLSLSLVTRWLDRYSTSGSEGLLPKITHYRSMEFKLKVVKSYINEGLSLRDCCSRYGIAAESSVLFWVRSYERSGIAGLREQRGRPKVMKKDKPPKKTAPLTRLEELEKENLYLRAENELLKKLEALAHQRQTPKKKR
jgi:transposase